MSQKTNSVIDESISPTPTIAATKLDTSVKNSTYTKIVKDLVTVKSETSVIFKNVSETVYTTANVNIRSSCTTAKDNVITVLKKGSSIKRIGVQSEWSKVLYNGKTGYIVTKYLTKVKPVADVSPFTYDKLIKDLKVTTKTNQLILVIGNSNKSSTVTFHVKDCKGKWHQQFSVVG
ncbi:MAG TPA: SH3 domain-containing protein, partial [Mobilitalea sp.]|nr:SH3 domain-containing protein [Mobilitalea sp.]